MKFVHIHLVINHLALYLCFFYTLFKSYKAYHQQEISKKITLVIQILLTFLLLILNFTGHEAEHQVASFLQDPEGSFMHNHEEWGEVTVKIGILNLVLHLLTLKYRWANYLTWISLWGLLILLFITSYYGGQLAHPEIR